MVLCILFWKKQHLNESNDILKVLAHPSAILHLTVRSVPVYMWKRGQVNREVACNRNCRRWLNPLIEHVDSEIRGLFMGEIQFICSTIVVIEETNCMYIIPLQFSQTMKAQRKGPLTSVKDSIEMSISMRWIHQHHPSWLGSPNAKVNFQQPPPSDLFLSMGKYSRLFVH